MVSLPLRSVSFPLAGWSEAVEVEQAVELHETHRFRPQLEPTTLSARHNEKKHDPILASARCATRQKDAANAFVDGVPKHAAGSSTQHIAHPHLC
jgi:hypothetical protein